MQTKNKVDTAKVQLLLTNPFFGAIVMRHPITVTKDAKLTRTACVDKNGEIFVNEDFMNKLSLPELKFLIAHEAMHVVYAHLHRLGERDPEVWNIAADYSVNDLLVSEEVGEMPNGGVYLPGASEKTTEELYEDLMRKQKKSKQSSGSSGDDNDEDEGGSAMGMAPLIKDIDPKMAKGLSPADAKAQEMAGKLEISQAMQSARIAGHLSSGLSAKLAKILDSKLPWYEILERYMMGKAERHESWSRPNKRYAGRFYLPRRERLPGMGELVVAIDVSGSISDIEVASFIGHLNRIIEQCRPSRTHVLFVTEEVKKATTYELCDYPLPTERNRWYGGTDMREVFRWQEENAPDAELAVVFTDGYTLFDDEESVETVWVYTKEATRHDAPFGETIRL